MLESYENFDLLTPLTFAIVGYSDDFQVAVPPGTGFFIAPYVALTAKHVIESLWDELGRPWERHRYPTTSRQTDYVVKVAQLLEIRPHRRDAFAQWEITGSTPCIETDAAFLFVVPDNERAQRMQWSSGFPSLELTPPPIGETVVAFGYPRSRLVDFAPGSSHFDFEGSPTLATGRVTAVYEDGRGTWRFPHFQTDARFEPGMSGAPVVHDGRICGIVSYGTTYEDGAAHSYVASLWPLLLPEVEANIDPRLQNAPLLDLLRTGHVKARNWQAIKAAIRVDVNEHAQTRLRLELNRENPAG